VFQDWKKKKILTAARSVKVLVLVSTLLFRSVCIDCPKGYRQENIVIRHLSGGLLCPTNRFKNTLHTIPNRLKFFAASDHAERAGDCQSYSRLGSGPRYGKFSHPPREIPYRSLKGMRG